jgi:hypothetical protein
MTERAALIARLEERLNALDWTFRPVNQNKYDSLVAWAMNTADALHAAIDALRESAVPPADRMDALTEAFDAGAEWRRMGGREVGIVEYLKARTKACEAIAADAAAAVPPAEPASPDRCPKCGQMSCIYSASPCAAEPPAPPVPTPVSAEANLAAANAILEAIEAALDGQPVSDFMESFPLVRRVMDLAPPVPQDDLATVLKELAVIELDVAQHDHQPWVSPIVRRIRRVRTALAQPPAVPVDLDALARETRTALNLTIVSANATAIGEYHYLDDEPAVVIIRRALATAIGAK